MEHSHNLLSFFVIISLVFIVSANDGGYKILNYDEDFPAYPWQAHREWIPLKQRRQIKSLYDLGDSGRVIPKNEMLLVPIRYNNTVRNQPAKRTSTFEEKMAETNTFGRGSGVMVIYGRVPVPDMLENHLTTNLINTES